MPTLNYQVIFEPSLAALVGGNVEEAIFEFSPNQGISKLFQFLKAEFKDDFPTEPKYTVFEVSPEGKEVPVNRLCSMRDGQQLKIYGSCDVQVIPAPPPTTASHHVSLNIVKRSPSTTASYPSTTPSYFGDVKPFDQVPDRTQPSSVGSVHELVVPPPIPPISFKRSPSRTSQPSSADNQSYFDEFVADSTPSVEGQQSRNTTPNYAAATDWSTVLGRTKLHRPWTEEFNLILTQHREQLTKVYMSLKPRWPIIVNEIDVYAMLLTNEQWFLLAAMAVLPFPSTLTQAETEVFERFAKKLPNDVMDYFVGPKTMSDRYKVLKEVTQALFELTGNGLYNDISVKRLIHRASYSRNKRKNQTKRIKYHVLAKKNGYMDEIQSIEAISRAIARRTGDDLELVEQTAASRVQELLREGNRTIKGSTDYFTKFPCFKRNVLLIHGDFMLYMSAKHPQKRSFNVRSCLREWSIPIQKLAMKKECHGHPEEKDREIRIVQCLFELGLKYHLSKKYDPCSTYLIFSTYSADIKSCKTDILTNFCIVVQRNAQNTATGDKFSLLLKNVHLEIPFGTFYDALQTYLELAYLFGLKYDEHVKAIIDFVEKLCNPKVSVFTACQLQLYQDLCRTADEEGFSHCKTSYFYQLDDLDNDRDKDDSEDMEGQEMEDE